MFLWKQYRSLFHLLSVQFCTYAVCATKRSGWTVLHVLKEFHSYSGHHHSHNGSGSITCYKKVCVPWM
jgi:hypothetical protein